MSRFGLRFLRSGLDQAVAPYTADVLAQLKRQLDRNAVLTAQTLIHRLQTGGKLSSLHLAEFKVFSQFGEDGIIQYLLQHVPIADPSFIEFGVEDYQEANTRFLLVNNNWRGLIIDGGTALDRLRGEEIYWRHELTAVQSFVTVENINALFERAGFRGDLGLLSIDIDGNDYWLWQAITSVSPRIVVCEYNALLGNRYAVTTPYRPDFDKTRAHYSNLFFGASLPALRSLAEQKGYRFVGTNSQGHNAFFVRSDLIGDLTPYPPGEGYVRSRFRSGVNARGELTFLSGDDRLEPIGDLQVEDVHSGQLRRVKDLT